MQISDILRSKGSQVTTTQETDTVEQAVRLLADKRVGALVVQDQWGKLAGIFSERDLVGALASRGTAAMALPVRDLMTTHVITCVGADRIETVMAKMTLNRIRHLPVLEDGKLAGIVSIGDLVHYRLDEKELEAGVLLDIARMRG
jgi:CBS domain-containing protein